MTTTPALTLIRGAEVLTLAGPQGTQPVHADLLLRDGRIEAIGPDLPVPQACTLVEARGKLLMPGLVNAHTHSSETFFLSLIHI